VKKLSLSARFSALVVALLFFSAIPAANAVSLSFSSGHDLISFAGDGSFAFEDVDADQNVFLITLDGPVYTAGNIIGTFDIGAITTTGTVESASVTGTGQFVIHDGSGHDWIGNVVWDEIRVENTAGNLNLEAVANMTFVSYDGGSNADLLALASAPAASNTITFQFNPAVSLAGLKSEEHSTTFSGSISTVPLPAAAWLFGPALFGFVRLARRSNGRWLG
jgi:hypothetical protein